MHYMFRHVIYVPIITDSMSNNQRLEQCIHVRPMNIRNQPPFQGFSSFKGKSPGNEVGSKLINKETVGLRRWGVLQENLVLSTRLIM